MDLSRAEVGHIQVTGLEDITSLVSEVPGRRAKQKLSTAQPIQFALVEQCDVIRAVLPE